MTPEQVDAALGLWAETAGGTARLVNYSENHTFRIEAPAGVFFLRVHRPGYQSAATIASELAWLTALRRDTGLPVPRPLPGHDGALLQEVAPAGGAARHAVLFAAEPGDEPSPAADLGTLFETLGGFAATAHLHVLRFVPPPGFTRQVWSAAAILDADGLWGDWRRAPGIDADIDRLLASADRRLRADLGSYGTAPGRFGLIHADMRLGNLLVDGDRVTLIDFDDCGFCWFMYDYAAAISFHEDDPREAQWRTRWRQGYERVRPLAAADIAIFDAMVLLRRMALLAWIGSHHETPLAQAHGPHFAAATAGLAARYLAQS